MRKLVRILLVILGTLFVCAAALYTTAWYHRIQAQRLLAAVKNLRIGVTTQAEYEEAVRPIASNTNEIRDEANQAVPGAYVMSPVPSWVWKTLNHVPHQISSALSHWAVLDWTIFEVDPTFKEGRLASLGIAEMQGEGHPLAGVVRIHAGVVQRLWPSEPKPFSGYSALPMGGNGRVIYTHVDMDDRATQEERRRALDFRFDCFTAFRSCSDGRQLLDPVMSSPLP